MTEISFHFNVPDRTLYTCRLLRKATRQGRAVVVTGTTASLEILDRALWAFDPIEFLPHLMLGDGSAALGRLRDTPIWLSERPSVAPHQELLVNLGDNAPEGFESYSRLIEIVSSAEAERVPARQRWRHYVTRGYPIQRHEVPG